MNLSTVFDSIEHSKIEKFVQIAGAEDAFAKLPDILRHELAKRRSPDFRFAKDIAEADESEDYQLTSSCRLNCIFVHVPKAAGISVAKALFGSRAGGHLPLRYYLWLYGAKQFDRYYKFTFVREPLDRVRSAYRFLMRGGMNDNDRQWARTYIEGYKDFSEFLEFGLKRPEISNSLHFRPQSDFLIDPRYKGIGVDYIGRLESIEQDFSFVAAKLGVSRKLPNLNRTRASKESGCCISDDALRVVRKTYQQDYELLGYS